VSGIPYPTQVYSIDFSITPYFYSLREGAGTITSVASPRVGEDPFCSQCSKRAK